jgi:Cu-processing system permease protein
MTAVMRVARFVARDLSRSRWLIGYAAFFALATWALLRFSDSEQKALLALVNVVLFVVPLASIVFGSMYLYGAREFVELLLAQPVPRRMLFSGLYLGVALPLGLAAAAGIAMPVALQESSTESLGIAALIVTMAAALSAAFAGLSAIIAYSIEDRARGLAAALGAWLVLAVVYDGVALLLATQFADYPIERPMLAAMVANPIDLARLLLLFQFDAAALLGYTGAVFQRFFAGAFGIAMATGALLLWTVAPALAGGRLFIRKDF